MSGFAENGDRADDGAGLVSEGEPGAADAFPGPCRDDLQVSYSLPFLNHLQQGGASLWKTFSMGKPLARAG